MSDTLFDDLPDGRNAPARPVPPRPTPAVFEGVSPFGEDTLTRNLPPVEKGEKGFGQAFDKGAPRKKATKARDHYPRAIKYLTERFGGFFWVCDGMKPNAMGGLYATDLLGVADIQGVTPEGRLVMVNVTADGDAVKAHLRKYSDRATTHGQAKRPVPDILAQLFECNVVVLILGYRQEGGKGSAWKFGTTRVTPELLAEYAARKRGPKR